MFAGFMSNSIVFYLAHAVFAGVVTVLLLMIFHAFFGHLEEKMILARNAPYGIMTTSVVAGVLLGNEYVGKDGPQLVGVS